MAHRALSAGALVNPKVAVVAHEKKSYFMHLAEKEKEYAYANDVGKYLIFDSSMDGADGCLVDRKEIYDVPKFS